MHTRGDVCPAYLMDPCACASILQAIHACAELTHLPVGRFSGVACFPHITICLPLSANLAAFMCRAQCMLACFCIHSWTCRCDGTNCTHPLDLICCALHVRIGVAVVVPDLVVLWPSLTVPGVCRSLRVTHSHSM